MEYISSKKEAKTFRGIVLDHLSKILELSTQEFRGGYREKKIVGNYIEEIYVPDNRKRILQSIEFLSYILKPFYKDKQKSFDEKIQKELKENLEKFDNKKTDYETFIVSKLKIMIELFQELNFLLHEQDYLKGESYEDKADEGDDDDD